MRSNLSMAALVLVLLTLAGCSGSGGVQGAGPEPDKVKAAIQSLGGDSDKLYQQKVIFKELGGEHFAAQDVYLVPSQDGKTFQIVDAQGRVYSDYGDLLRNNKLPN
jgi:hypothetical protein